MLNGIVKITNIDYEATIVSLISRISEKTEKKGTKLARLIQKLGDDAENAIRVLLAYIPDEGKGKLVCELANHYQEKILSKLKEGLDSRDLGQRITVEKILFQESEEGMAICLQNVQLDYKALLDNEAVQRKMGEAVERYVNQSSLGQIPGLAGFLKGKAGIAAKTAVHLAPEMIEHKALEAVNMPDNKEKLSCLLENSLKKEGLVMDISQIEVYKVNTSDREGAACLGDGAAEAQAEKVENGKFALSEEVEEMVLNAAAELLKDLSHRRRNQRL